MSGLSVEEIGKVFPYRVHFATRRHGIVCPVSQGTSTPHAHKVTCPKCLEAMKGAAHEAECESAAVALLAERAS